jgi:hypothetical protein
LEGRRSKSILDDTSAALLGAFMNWKVIGIETGRRPDSQGFPLLAYSLIFHGSQPCPNYLAGLTISGIDNEHAGLYHVKEIMTES